MPYLLLAIGVVMAITGAQAAMTGWDIVVVERGWALLIAGAVLGTGGMIVAALGLVMLDLRRALRQAAPSAAAKTGFGLPGLAGKLPGRAKPAAAPVAAPATLTAVTPAAEEAPVDAMSAEPADAAKEVSPVPAPQPVIAAGSDTPEPKPAQEANAHPEAKPDAEPKPVPDAKPASAAKPAPEKKPLFGTMLKRAMPKPDLTAKTGIAAVPAKADADPVIPVSDAAFDAGKELSGGKEPSPDSKPATDDKFAADFAPAVPAAPVEAKAEPERAPEPELSPAPERDLGMAAANAEPSAGASAGSKASEPEMPQPALAELAPKEPAITIPTVVKTYTAGGHSYIMFSDGTIEADTPEGLFTFKSLDELKTFIAEKAGTAGPGAEGKA